ncbi:MAG: glycerol-3-phosphate 1-O-acyltransferase PlsY [Candidatus Sumerlaeaceae bacterium]|nr:glycerol-3-phosphate 1-O-acyltransferase PlsY [Candidatus Sumerlaeaceae bacterium]
MWFAIALPIALVIAYFVGSIPTGLLLGNAFRGIDLREHGSGNLGATNAFRILGTKLGVSVLGLDMLKGLAPVAVLPAILGISPASPGTQLLIGAAAIAGHVFSIFVNFKGGKGVATALGVYLAIAPYPTLATLAVGIAIILISGYVSLASLFGAIFLPLVLYWNAYPFSVVVVTEIIAIMVIVRHKGNAERILNGTENKIWKKLDAMADDEPIPFAGDNQ